MVQADDVIRVYESLSANKIRVWLTGGWGIDALLGEQTRPHKDVDILVLVDHVARLQVLLGRAGYHLKELWSENAWVLDAQGAKVPTAFVLEDPHGRQVDAHAMRLDEQGNGIPAWADERPIFTREDLSGLGKIAGLAVPCLSPEMQLLCHTGYDLPPEHLRDLALLRERLGV